MAIGTQVAIEDGRYTGDILFYAYGPRKADAMRSLAEERGYDLSECYAYSDSSTDLPMLEAVGHPIAVNPDSSLRATALARDWPIRDFARPVDMSRTIERKQAVCRRRRRGTRGSSPRPRLVRPSSRPARLIERRRRTSRSTSEDLPPHRTSEPARTLLCRHETIPTSGIENSDGSTPRAANTSRTVAPSNQPRSPREGSRGLNLARARCPPTTRADSSRSAGHQVAEQRQPSPRPRAPPVAPPGSSNHRPPRNPFGDVRVPPQAYGHEPRQRAGARVLAMALATYVST